jgi:hypothetical protein
LSTLGKIVTIFVVLASIALAVMNVTFVRSTQDWRAEALKAKGHMVRQQQINEVLKSAIAARNKEVIDTQTRYVTKIDAMKGTVSALEQDKKDLSVEKRDADLAKAKSDADIGKLTVSLGIVQDAKKDQEASHAAAIATAERANDDALALAKIKYNLVRQVATLEKKVRLYEQQIVEQGKALAFFKDRFPGDLPKIVEVPSHDLVGVVRNVKDRVAEISLGSSDGVREGQVFLVSRANTYLADLKITRVDDNSAVGQLKTLKGDVQEGDDVTYELRR